MHLSRLNRICRTQALSRPQAQRACGKSCNSVMHDRKAVFHSCSSQLVKHNARPPSIEGKAVHSKPARPLSRESGTSREVAVHLSNFTPDAVRTSRYRGRAPCPIQWALSLSSCSTRSHGGLSRPPYGVGCRGAVPLDSTHYSAGCCPCQQFF